MLPTRSGLFIRTMAGTLKGSAWNSLGLQSQHQGIAKSSYVQQSHIGSLSMQEYLEAMPNPVRQVFFSQSTDVYSNLALEDWLYRHHDFQHKHLLFLWRNSPSVVIGRHQNPWTEANLSYLRQRDINLVRRNSGGGTVFHDEGNINCTFFTRKDKHRRRKNLDIICRAIQRLTESESVEISVNDRDDIVLNGKRKISGTAARIGSVNAYHHCTVLVDSNTATMCDALHSHQSEDLQIESRSTQSVRVPVACLRSHVRASLTVEQVEEAIAREFVETDINGKNIGRDPIQMGLQQRGFQLVMPKEEWFPGLDNLRSELASDEWVFRKTPSFSICQKLTVPLTSNKELKVDVRIVITKGHLDAISVVSSQDTDLTDHMPTDLEKVHKIVRCMSYINDHIQGEPLKLDILKSLRRITLPISDSDDNDLPALVVDHVHRMLSPIV